MFIDVCDNVTGIEVCGFTENKNILKNIKYFENETFFLQNKMLCIKGYNIVKNSFLVIKYANH